jgi:hypothetical protein
MSDALTASGIRQVTAFRRNETATATLDWKRVVEHFEVAATGPWGMVTASGDDAFSALTEVRQQLEDQGWFLAVNGARRDTYPSGMGRGAGGLAVYEFRIGERAGASVPTFADADPDRVGTVSEQEDHFQGCWSSVR